MQNEDNKIYEIVEDCMYDRERFEWIPTIWQCSCCHATVSKTDDRCWHCRAKLKYEERLYRIRDKEKINET